MIPTPNNPIPFLPEIILAEGRSLPFGLIPQTKPSGIIDFPIVFIFPYFSGTFGQKVTHLIVFWGIGLSPPENIQF